MKKVFALPIMAIGLMVSQSWGEYTACTADLGKDYYCEYKGPLSCWQLNKGATDSDNCTTKKADCIKDGVLYYGATKAGEGAEVKCADIGGIWSGDGNNPNFNNGVPLWCQWTTGCQPLTDDEGLDNCKVNGSVYSGVSDSDVGANKECKNSGTWTGDGKDPNKTALGCCNWDGNGCFKVFEASEWADCAAEYRYATCPGDEAGTCTGSPLAPPSSSSTQSSSSSASSSSSSSSSSTPSSSSAVSSSSSVGTSSSSSDDNTIISYNSTPVIGLNVVHFARSLRIASDKDAKISLFDIQGKQMLSQKVQSGTTTINLEKQKLGVYYAVVRSGSQKQMVKIVLK